MPGQHLPQVTLVGVCISCFGTKVALAPRRLRGGVDFARPLLTRFLLLELEPRKVYKESLSALTKLENFQLLSLTSNANSVNWLQYSIAIFYLDVSKTCLLLWQRKSLKGTPRGAIHNFFAPAPHTQQEKYYVQRDIKARKGKSISLSQAVQATHLFPTDRAEALQRLN